MFAYTTCSELNGIGGSNVDEQAPVGLVPLFQMQSMADATHEGLLMETSEMIDRHDGTDGGLVGGDVGDNSICSDSVDASGPTDESGPNDASEPTTRAPPFRMRIRPPGDTLTVDTACESTIWMPSDSQTSDFHKHEELVRISTRAWCRAQLEKHLSGGHQAT